MKCPVCAQDDVDREDHLDMSGICEIPTAEYQCNDCGAHFEWRRRKPLYFFWSPKYEPLETLPEERDECYT